MTVSRQLQQGGRRTLNVASTRVDNPANIVPAIKEAVAVTEKGSPFLLEFVVKEGHDFSRYNTCGAVAGMAIHWVFDSSCPRIARRRRA